MKDGGYVIVFSAGGYRGTGELVLEGNRGRGRQGRCEMELQLNGAGPKLTGVATVLMDASAIHNAMIPLRFSVALTGVEREDTFSLIGIGPLGMIVEIDGEQAGDR
jgi:hypothetical protein